LKYPFAVFIKAALAILLDSIGSVTKAEFPDISGYCIVLIPPGNIYIYI
jgi:hypothetical protein